jgi:hypothetical protein
VAGERVRIRADVGVAFRACPPVGTSAALFAAAAHPERLASVVVGTGGAAVPIQLGEPAKYASAILDSITSNR